MEASQVLPVGTPIFGIDERGDPLLKKNGS
jgi:hypothetical protein